MADLKKVLGKLKQDTIEGMEELTSEELEELEGGVNVACAPQNSSCPTNNNGVCPPGS